jgi:hypothetical protein
LEYKKVASDLENSLREITHRSGGEVIFSGDIGSALHSVEKKEDVCYVLTYEPKRPERRGKIKIKVNNSRCRLLYDDNLRSDYIAQYVQQKNSPTQPFSCMTCHLTGGNCILPSAIFA